MRQYTFCFIIYHQLSGLIKFVVACNSWEYVDQNLQCKPCDFSCAQCKGPFNTDCLRCNAIENRVLLNGRCVCQDHYYEDRTQIKCMGCHFSCLSCVDEAGCTSCDIGMKRVINVKQECSCMSGYYESGSGKCERCDQSCLECLGSSSFECKSCIADQQTELKLLKESGEGSCQCKEGYYSEANLCYKCRLECQSCINQQSCESCKSKLWVFEEQMCKCMNGYFMDFNFDCEKCDDNCAECEGSSLYCIKCDDQNKSYVLDSHVNICICNDGYFMREQICVACHYQCQMCIYEEDYCLDCPGMSKRWLNLSVRKCICQQHYFDSGQQVCDECRKRCRDCLGNKDHCIACYNGQNRRLDESKHDCPCQLNYYERMGEEICQKCDPFCLKCTFDNQYWCQACKQIDHLVLKDGICSCEEDYYQWSDEYSVECKQFNRIVQINVFLQTESNYIRISAFTRIKIEGQDINHQFSDQEKQQYNIIYLNDTQYAYDLKIGNYQQHIDYTIDFIQLQQEQINFGILVYRQIQESNITVLINHGPFGNQQKVIPKTIQITNYHVRLHGTIDYLKSIQEIGGGQENFLNFLSSFKIIVYFLNAPQAIVLLLFLNLQISQLSYEYLRIISIFIFADIPKWNEVQSENSPYLCHGSNIIEKNLQFMGLCEVFIDNPQAITFYLQFALYLSFFTCRLIRYYLNNKTQEIYQPMANQENQLLTKTRTLQMLDKLLLIMDWVVYKVQDALLLKFVVLITIQFKYIRASSFYQVASLLFSLTLVGFLLFNTFRMIKSQRQPIKEYQTNGNSLIYILNQLKNSVINRINIFEQFRKQSLLIREAKNQLQISSVNLSLKGRSACNDLEINSGKSLVIYFHQIQTLKKIILVVSVITLYNYQWVQWTVFIVVLAINLIFKLTLAPYILKIKNKLSLTGDLFYFVGVIFLILQGRKINILTTTLLMQDINQVRNAQLLGEYAVFALFIYLLCYILNLLFLITLQIRRLGSFARIKLRRNRKNE